jgi:hypothetical protein
MCETDDDIDVDAAENVSSNMTRFLVQFYCLKKFGVNVMITFRLLSTILSMRKNGVEETVKDQSLFCYISDGTEVHNMKYKPF